MSASAFDRLRVRDLVGWSLLAQLVALPVTMAIGGRHMDERILLAVILLVLLLVGLVRARIARLDWRRLIGPRLSRDDLPLLAVLPPLILIMIASMPLVFVPISWFAPEWVTRHMLTPPALQVDSIPEWIALVVAAVLVAPAVEETLFRGLLMHRWARRWGTLTGVVLSSALFAFMHQEWLGHFCFGVMMCALYLRTGKLRLPILAHTVNNALAAGAALPGAISHEHEAEETLAQFQANAWLAIPMFILGVGLAALYLARYWPAGLFWRSLRSATPYDAAFTPPAGVMPVTASTSVSTSAS